MNTISQNRKKFYIIDGHSHLYAAYYAIRGLTSPSGEPTNAVYGMTSVILKILREHQPDYIAAVFDPPGRTFRQDIFEEYKSQRPPMPDDLVTQVNRIQQVMLSLGIKVVMIDGYEADDVIATLAKQAQAMDIDVVICSKDKDLEQLINHYIKIYDSTKDKFTDIDELMNKKGITPQQVIDMLALMGDKVDNIPGIPGVGEKTAAKLIKNYGSIDNIIKNKDYLPPKIKKYLSDEKNIDQLYLSRRLVTLKTDIDVEFDPEQYRQEIPDKDKLITLFNELGFKRFLDQLGINEKKHNMQSADEANGANEANDTNDAQAQPSQLRFEQITSLESLRNLIEKWSQCEYLAIDTETTSVNAMSAELVGLSFAIDETMGWYLPLRTSDNQALGFQEALTMVKPLLENPTIKKIGHNIKYDLLVLRNVGINVATVAFDTMIASYVLDPARSSHSLDSLASQLLDYNTTKIKELIGSGKNQLTLDQVATETVTQYSAEDALITYRLFKLFDRQLCDENLLELFQKVEMPLVKVLAEMEFTGVAIDTEKLAELSNNLADRLKQLTDEIFSYAKHPFNIDSPKQLGEVLFDELNLPAKKLTKTGRSTDVGVLEDLARKHPLPKLILEYRQLSKLKNTYIDKLPEMINPQTGKIHASFNQTVTATGRLSSSDPNLQNIPIRSEIGRQIRSAFIPENRDNNYILACDYSQIELRLLAHLSEDENLITAFRDDQDIHAFVASQIFNVYIKLVTPNQRAVAKTVNFGIIYGQTAHGLAKTLGISRTEAQKFINAYFKRYPGVKEFTRKCIAQAREQGYVETMMGRRRKIPEINSKSPSLRAFAERTAVNTVAQGSAADLIKLAMINIHNEIQAGCISAKMLIQVHDELVFETPKANIETTAKEISQLMSSAMELKVPLKVDSAWGENWLEGK